jgi:hypothetical protein
MPVKTIAGLISNSGEFAALTARTRAVSALQTLYANAAPEELAGASRVKSVREGTLVVAAQNAAVAAKLKQLAPRLLASIRKAQPGIRGLRIEVEVRGRTHPGESARERPTLTPATVERFAALAARVPPGTLKSALVRLVGRRRRANRSSR